MLDAFSPSPSPPRRSRVRRARRASLEFLEDRVLLVDYSSIAVPTASAIGNVFEGRNSASASAAYSKFTSAGQTLVNLTSSGSISSSSYGHDENGDPYRRPGGGSFSIDGDFRVQTIAGPGEATGQAIRVTLTTRFNGDSSGQGSYTAS